MQGPLSKKAADWTIETCPKCGQHAVVTKGMTVEDSHHWRTNHEINQGFDGVENFQLEEPSPKKPIPENCPDCDTPLEQTFFAGGEFRDCPKCGWWDEVGEEAGDLFENNLPNIQNQTLRVITQAPKRTSIVADQITPNIWLGDVANGWYMRDKGTGKPFDAILNVSQHSYTPPPDVEYIHIPIEEYSSHKKQRKKRVQDIAKAIRVLEQWTAEGKQVYLHCSEGMNRSPSVLTGVLFREKQRQQPELDKESLYNDVILDIQKRRPIANPEGVMEDALRKFLGLPTWDEVYKNRATDNPYGGQKSVLDKYFKSKPKNKFKKHDTVLTNGESAMVLSEPIEPGGFYWVRLDDNRTVPVQEKHLRKPTIPLKKKSLAESIGFIKVAITKPEMYNFYVVMQLPPEFFKAFPKWDAYAKAIVENTSSEYAEQLERLVRNEAHSTYEQLGHNRSDEEEYHEHDWVPKVTGHKCYGCGEFDNHEWSNNSTEDDHMCGICGGEFRHNFDLDHECSECDLAFDHIWALNGDQEFVCEKDDTNMGCGAVTNILPEDVAAPFFGDFWEDQHRHKFSEILLTDKASAYVYESTGVRCRLCGRAFIDKGGSVQEKFPFEPEKDYYMQEEEYSKNIQEKNKNQQKNWQTMVLSGNCPDCSSKSSRPVNLSQFTTSDGNEYYQCLICGRKWDHNGFWVHSKTVLSKKHFILLARTPPLGKVREIPRTNIDTSKWFDFDVQDPEGKRWIPWKVLRSQYRPSEWRALEQSLINNPESVLTYLVPQEGGDFREAVDQETIRKFKDFVKIKKSLTGMSPEDIKDSIGRLKGYEGQLRSDPDDVFLTLFGLKHLFNQPKPDEKDMLTFTEIKNDMQHAWKNYLSALTETDPTAAELYEGRYQEPPTPQWAEEAVSSQNVKVIAKGVGTSPGTVTGRAATTAEMAMQMGGKIVLVRPETTPEDIGAMRKSAGFLTAFGGPTAHAAIVARQMGKPCITGARFTISGDTITFPDGGTIAVGGLVTINGKTGEVSVPEQTEQEFEMEEQPEMLPQEGEDWDTQFEGLLQYDQEMKKAPETWVERSKFDNADLRELASAFKTTLKAPSYGGAPWALAAVRASQLQEAIGRNMPWKYRGMLVDQINTLQHNTGNIFSGKSWPGRPQSWINDVLDTKGSEHAMQWIEMAQTKSEWGDPEYISDSVLTDETKQMLRDYRVWARRSGYPSIYGEDLSRLSPQQLDELRSKEKDDVRQRRLDEIKKQKYASVVVTRVGDTYTAFDKISGSRLRVFKRGNISNIHKLSIPDHWKNLGIARALADTLSNFEEGHDTF